MKKGHYKVNGGQVHRLSGKQDRFNFIVYDCGIYPVEEIDARTEKHVDCKNCKRVKG
ncbi:MAG: hypothetical protein WC455_20445 [Dehalococcoidia bacterium]